MEKPLKDRLNDDLKRAMRDGNTLKRSVIRLVLSSIHNAEIARQGPLEEPDVIGVVAKEARQHQESIDAFKQGNRPDLVAKEEAELAVLREYLPQQASREEIASAARGIIEEVGAEGPRDKGKVMPRLIAEFKGKADGRAINEIVTDLLNP